MAKLKANKPTADVLMNSMRAMGYSFEAAIADIVDNSVSAQARNIVLRFPIDPSDCCVAVCDDGIGMNKKELLDAMKYGSQLKSANRSEDDLGRFGLGMKAASLSQCRRLTVASKKDGKLSANAAMLLLGKEDRDVLFERAPHMMWRLIAANGDIKDYELFGIPFITVTDRVFSRIRNLTYRYMPNQQSLFPMETEQYDTWMLRELLNNCIAHSYYQSGERIYVNECEDSIVITNPGSFLPQTVEAVLQPTYNPPFYRNQLLADAMVKFHMIDTATSGIKKVYRIQKEKFFPLPDYNLSNVNQVAVTVYGKILDEKYTQLLYKNNESLDLETVFLLDKIQKHVQITKEQAVRLKKRGLVEGRYPNIYVSFKVASMVGKKAEYVHNKGLDENICRQLILEALKNAPTTQHELLEVLDVGALPGHLSTEQKSRKLSNILQKMKKEGLVKPTGSRRYAVWSLV